ncbi:MAG: sugar phosphate nucleotidyltransferase [Acidimicrobiales bacterium]
MPTLDPNPADTPVVVLCGGQGTRIREASEKLPKPLINIGNQPILWHIMKLYSSHGFRRFILCLGYKGWDIKQYFLEYQDMMSDMTVHTKGGNEKTYLTEHRLDDWEVSLVDTGLNTGTGGRIARVGHLIDTDFFMVTYGDGLGDVDLSAELTSLASSDYLGLVTGVHPTSRYGELGVESDGLVVNFAEKPSSEGWVSGGFFAFRKEFLSYLPDDDEHFFEHDPMKRLTHENNLGLFPHTGFWMGMDTFREYTALNEMWERGETPWLNAGTVR